MHARSFNGLPLKTTFLQPLAWLTSGSLDFIRCWISCHVLYEYLLSAVSLVVPLSIIYISLCLFLFFCADCPRFCVSLVCGPQPERDDIAFQLTAHFDTNWVIRNSKLNKEWGTEEGASTRKFPFQRQQPFTVEIFTSPSAYVVSRAGFGYSFGNGLITCSLLVTLLENESIKNLHFDLSRTDCHRWQSPLRVCSSRVFLGGWHSSDYGWRHGQHDRIQKCSDLSDVPFH